MLVWAVSLFLLLLSVFFLLLLLLRCARTGAGAGAGATTWPICLRCVYCCTVRCSFVRSFVHKFCSYIYISTCSCRYLFLVPILCASSNAFSAYSRLWCAHCICCLVFNCCVDVMQTNTNFVVIKAKLVIIRWCDEWQRFQNALNRDRPLGSYIYIYIIWRDVKMRRFQFNPLVLSWINAFTCKRYYNCRCLSNVSNENDAHFCRHGHGLKGVTN